MESRDFSRDGAPASVEVAVEEEGIIPVTTSLAKNSAFLFHSRRFKECADVLDSLLAKKNDDPKVIHNIAVVEYFKDGCSDPKKLLNMLASVKKNSEELAHASGEQVEFSDSVASHQFTITNIGSIAYADEFDTSIMKLNMAVVFNSLHDYACALSLLNPLYHNIEPIDETTALHVCLLLLDISLASRDMSRAADVIQYLERAFGVGNILSQEDNGVTAHHSFSNQLVKVPVSSSSGILVPEGPDSSSVINTSETAPTGTLSDSIEYENLLSRLDDCDSVDSLNRESSNDIPRKPTDMSVPAIDLKLKLQLYKVRFLILARNMKGAKREIKIAMNNSRGKDSSMALLLKAQLEYARGNHSKAIKLLGNRTEPKFSSMLDNNLGCIFHQQKKYNLSTVMFSKALESSPLLKQKPLTLNTYSQDKSFHIIYNLGLANLFCGKSSSASSCFKRASNFFPKDPILWLRYAECCLLPKEGFLYFDGSSFSQAENIHVQVLGSGKWQHLQIETNSRNILAKDNSLATNDFQPSVSVDLARRFLLIALNLLNKLINLKGDGNSTTATEEDRSIEVPEEVSIKNSNRKSIPNSDNQEIKTGLASNGNIFSSSVSFYEDMSKEENLMIMQAVLAKLAYVELCLENPLKALSFAKTLQDIPNCSKIYTFLSRVYAAEAFCRLNQPMEAVKILSIYITDGTIDLPYSDEDMEMQHLEKSGDVAEDLNNSASAITTQKLEFLNSLDACGILYINLASFSVMEGDIDKAVSFVNKGISIIPNNPRAILAAVYIDLLIGKTEAAVMRLKHSNRVIFHPHCNVESSI